MRTVGTLLFLVIVAGGIGAFWLYNNVDSVVENMIEQRGTQVTKTNVAVDGVSIKLGQGQATIGALAVANPKGFSKDNAMAIDGMRVVLDTDRTNLPGDMLNLGAPTVIYMKELTILRPVVKYELSGGSSNVDQLRANVERNASSGSGGASTGSGEMRFVIDKLTITQGEIVFQTGGGKLASSDLPAIVRRNIGANSGGVTAAQLGRELVGEVTANALAQVVTGGIRALLGGAVEGGGTLGEGLTEGLKSIFD